MREDLQKKLDDDFGNILTQTIFTLVKHYRTTYNPRCYRISFTYVNLI